MQMRIPYEAYSSMSVSVIMKGVPSGRTRVTGWAKRSTSGPDAVVLRASIFGLMRMQGLVRFQDI